MWDLNRRNQFAWKTARGRYITTTYSEAWRRLKRGDEVYERAMPDHSVTPREKAQIPWTRIIPPDDFEF